MVSENRTKRCDSVCEVDMQQPLDAILYLYCHLLVVLVSVCIHVWLGLHCVLGLFCWAIYQMEAPLQAPWPCITVSIILLLLLPLPLPCRSNNSPQCLRPR